MESKDKNNDTLFYFILSFASFNLSFIYFFSILNIFNRANLLSDFLCKLISSLLALIVTIIVFVYVDKLKREGRKKRFGNWLSKNIFKLFLGYFISLVFFISFETQIIWDIDRLTDIIIIEWAIFSIEIMIFLVWNSFVLPHIRRKEPQKPEKTTPLSEEIYYENKLTFYQLTMESFNSITFLTINMILIAIATVSTCMSTKSVTLFNQSMVIATLYFCTNTIGLLFFDIIRPLREEKRNLISKAKITEEDIEKYRAVSTILSNGLTDLNKVDSITDLTEKEKDEIKQYILKMHKQYSDHNELTN